jgi:hypothetical protein
VDAEVDTAGDTVGGAGDTAEGQPAAGAAAMMMRTGCPGWWMAMMMRTLTVMMRTVAAGDSAPIRALPASLPTTTTTAGAGAGAASGPGASPPVYQHRRREEEGYCSAAESSSTSGQQVPCRAVCLCDGYITGFVGRASRLLTVHLTRAALFYCATAVAAAAYIAARSVHKTGSSNQRVWPALRDCCLRASPRRAFVNVGGTGNLSCRVLVRCAHYRFFCWAGV